MPSKEDLRAVHRVYYRDYRDRPGVREHEQAMRKSRLEDPIAHALKMERKKEYAKELKCDPARRKKRNEKIRVANAKKRAEDPAYLEKNAG